MNHVVFSDEKKFNLGGPDCYSSYWHDLRHKDPPRLNRNFGGDSAMCWAAFSSSSKTPMCFISSNMNSKMYTDLLGDILIPFIDDKMEDSAIFQQDNASIHVSIITKSWFVDRNIHVLNWPACNPDMNPIKNLWGILSRRVYANSRQFGDIAELKQEINSAWRSIGQEHYSP